MPVFNVENYLKQCLDSLLNQNFSGEYEVICINDGSTDKSMDVLRDYEVKYSNLIVIDKENGGASAARNEGLKKAKGSCIMFFDSDDYLTHNNVLTLMYNELQEHNLDFVIADFEYDFEDKSKNYRISRSKRIKDKIMSGREFYDTGIASKSITAVVWNKLYKKDFLINNNLYFIEGVIYEDMDFTPRAFYLAKRVKYIDEVICMYRQREGSVMHTQNVNHIKDYFVIADSLREFNSEIKSKTLLDSELYIYVMIILKLNHIKDDETKQTYKSMLKKRNVITKFLKSSRIKDKLFSFYCMIALA